MSWDLMINPSTGDLQWTARRDLNSVEGDALIKQRILVRLLIQRGTFIYDDNGTLGSRLYSLLNQGIPRTVASIESIVREALDEMEDISITEVQVFLYQDGSGVVDMPNQVAVRISYQLTFTDIAISAADNTAITTSLFTLPV